MTLLEWVVFSFLGSLHTLPLPCQDAPRYDHGKARFLSQITNLDISCPPLLDHIPGRGTNAGSLMSCSGLQQFLYQSGWNIAPLQSCERVCRCGVRARVEPPLSNGGRKHRDFGARKRYLWGMPLIYLPWQWSLRPCSHLVPEH